MFDVYIIMRTTQILEYLCLFKPYLRHMKCFICHYKGVYLLILMQGIGERCLNYCMYFNAN